MYPNVPDLTRYQSVRANLVFALIFRNMGGDLAIEHWANTRFAPTEQMVSGEHEVRPYGINGVYFFTPSGSTRRTLGVTPIHWAKA
jgi:hypothetical protein